MDFLNSNKCEHYNNNGTWKILSSVLSANIQICRLPRTVHFASIVYLLYDTHNEEQFLTYMI
jgi:hypothetical protein